MKHEQSSELTTGDAVLGSIVFVLVIWLTINVLTGFLGILSADDRSCRDRMSRIEYVFPGFEAGCWLGSAPKTEDENER